MRESVRTREDTMTNVLLVEDSRISRMAIESGIVASDRYRLVASIENAANAEIACLRGEVDLVLMDVCTAEDESGLTAAEKIKRHHPEIKVIIMTSMPEYSFITKAKASGCDSFWYKEYGDEDLLDVCDRTMRGESVWPSSTPPMILGETDSRTLTDRELEVLRELAQGKKYEEISQDLGVTVNTVKYHVKNLLIKTGYRNAIQLVVDAVNKSLILPKY